MPLKPFVRLLIITLFAAIGSSTVAQVRQMDNRPRNCAVYGRVTIGEKPAADAQVIVSEVAQSRNGQSSHRSAADGSPIKTVFKTRTDADGLYQFTGLPAGQHQIRVLARALISAEKDLDRELGRTITLDDGETREKVDFALVRGGVLTGRVADAEGRPLIANAVKLFRVERDGLSNVEAREGRGDFPTDDRGVYRAYGLRPGNYVISAGGDVSYFDGISGTRKYRRTFHPDVLEEKQARIIKLSAGEEKNGIDIKLGSGGKRYEAIGRVVDAQTGKPVANASVSCSKEIQNREEENDSAYDQTDATGKFRLAGLSSGRYVVRLLGNWDQGIEYYAEGQFFELSGEDASGIVIKATSGGVLSGVAVIEGASDPGFKAKLAQVMLIIFIEGEPPSSHQTPIKPDGTFRVAGVAPGKVRIISAGLGDPSFQFLRIERSGGEVKDLLTISKGEKINDLRLVFGKGSGIIRGQVQIIGEPLPKGWQLLAQAWRVGGGGDATGMNQSFSTVVDDRGRFILEGLFSGNYELTIASYLMAAQNTADGQVPISQQQIVSVTNGTEVQVNVRFNPTGKQEER